MNDISDERVEAVREQVKRICSSERFANSRKLIQFLRLVVEESLAGRGDQIKEYSIGLEVYNRPSGYDPRVDATVRVEAAKLRKRIGEYYAAEGTSDPIVITIPKGRYAPAFEYPQPKIEQHPKRFPWWIGAAALVFIMALGSWWAFSPKPGFKTSGVRLISIFPGSHAEASFSPDGATIAFIARNGGGPAQVWVKNLSHGDPLQITDGETDANRPRWSPKTDQIVFARKGRGIWTVPPLGGPARRIIDQGRNPDFSPEGSQLVFEKGRQLWVAQADGSGQRVLSEAPKGTIGISTPAFSPDGKWIAVFCKEVGPKGDLWVVPASGGQARRLTFDRQEGGDPAWTPDGRWIVFSSARSGTTTLWRVQLSGRKLEQVTSGAGEDSAPAISRDGKALLYGAHTTLPLEEISKCASEAVKGTA